MLFITLVLIDSLFFNPKKTIYNFSQFGPSFFKTCITLYQLSRNLTWYFVQKRNYLPVISFWIFVSFIRRDKIFQNGRNMNWRGKNSDGLGGGCCEFWERRLSSIINFPGSEDPVLSLVQVACLLLKEVLKDRYLSQGLWCAVLGSEQFSKSKFVFLFCGKIWLVWQHIWFGRLPSCLEFDLRVEDPISLPTKLVGFSVATWSWISWDHDCWCTQWLLVCQGPLWGSVSISQMRQL